MNFLHPYAQVVYGLLLLAVAIWIVRRSTIKYCDRKNDFNRGAADAQQFMRNGMSAEALRAYTSLMETRNKYGEYEAGMDSIVKEQA